jgi:hypothetical protein
MNWANLQKSPYLTTALSLVLSIGLLNLIFFDITKENIEQSIIDNISDQVSVKTQESLLPPDSVRLKNNIGDNSTSQSAPIKNDNVSQKTISQNQSAQNNIDDIKVSSTIEGRNKDRILLGEYLGELISEYRFLYQSDPKIYLDKSGNELNIEGSNNVYLYEDTKNRTNAIGATLPSDSYKFAFVGSCDGVIYDDFSLLYFFYEKQKMNLCIEGNLVYEVIIF